MASVWIKKIYPTEKAKKLEAYLKSGYPGDIPDELAEELNKEELLKEWEEKYQCDRYSLCNEIPSTLQENCEDEMVNSELGVWFNCPRNTNLEKML